MKKSKKHFVEYMVIALVIAASISAWGQSGATLLVTTDLDCNWKVDGSAQGLLKADDAKVMAVSLGKHLVQASSTDNLDEWRSVINVTQAGQEVVEIQLKPVRQTRLTQQAEADWKQHPTWSDPETGLMWTRQDNPTDVSLEFARAYCQNLKLADHSGWRLPKIDELSGLYDPTQNVNGLHIKGGIRSTCCMWSDTLQTIYEGTN